MRMGVFLFYRNIKKAIMWSILFLNLVKFFRQISENKKDERGDSFAKD